MGAGRTVAVFTGELDVTADAVIVELHDRGIPVFRCDPADFPTRVRLAARSGVAWTGCLRTATRELDLSDVACAWWRRPDPVTVAADVAHRDWARGEAVAGFRGLLAGLPWLNHPDAIRAAEYKPLQLAVAARSGLDVPPTVVTNDPVEARAFAAEHGPIIYKPLRSGFLGDGRMIYTTPVGPADLDDSIAVTAHMFQSQIPKAFELRVTVVDSRIFAARLDVTSEKGRDDWRADQQSIDYSTHDLPAGVVAAVRRYMNTQRLRFAALDFIVTPDGEYVFLEANPNGQWAWIEDETGLPIAAAIADALEGFTS